MANLEKIAEELSGLTVLEAADLAKLLEDKWGVSAAAPVVVAAAAPADGGAAAEEQTEFDVILASFGDKKINVIKEIMPWATSRIYDPRIFVTFEIILKFSQSFPYGSQFGNSCPIVQEQRKSSMNSTKSI